MKNEIIYFLLAGFFSVLIGGVFLGLILDVYFSGKLAIGDMATWAAALGTLCTFVFLVKQNIQLNHRQNRLEEQQQQMWDEQSEIANLQKFQTHKNEFNKLIMQIEQKYPEYKFTDPIALYAMIFPGNNFHTASVKIQDTINKKSYLPYVYKTFNAISTTENQKTSFEHYQRIIHDIADINQLLNIKNILPPKLGAFNQHFALQHTNFSIFDTYDLLIILGDIIRCLLEFSCHNNAQVDTPSKHLAIQKNYSNFLHSFLSRERIISSLNLPKNEGLFLLLFNVYFLWCEFGDYTAMNKNDQKDVRSFVKSFYSEKNITTLISDAQRIKIASKMLSTLKAQKTNSIVIGKINKLEESEYYNSICY